MCTAAHLTLPLMLYLRLKLSKKDSHNPSVLGPLYSD
jgi:hypothetical protein